MTHTRVQEAPEFYTKVFGTSPYAPSGSAVPADGLQGLAFDQATNRIANSGWNYDAAGNQTRTFSNGVWQTYQYDAANRLVRVKDANQTVIASYTYGDDNQRLITEEANTRTYYVVDGNAVIAEYTETSTTPCWSKSYIYLPDRLLSTLTPNGSGGEAVEYHHPDRLGTRLVTNPTTGGSFEQVTLPFGTALSAESTGATTRRFTSYERSDNTKLDYAVNRHYDAQQGRFTQVDPAGMAAASIARPQTLNMFAYCANDPINRIDADGLGLISFFKKILRGIAKILTNKWVLLIAGIALGLLSGFAFFLAFSYATVNTTFLAYGIALAAMSALLIVGAFHQGFLSKVKAIGGFISGAQNIAGMIGGVINGGMLGTPPWNPSSGVGPVSSFQNIGGGLRRYSRRYRTAQEAAIAILKRINRKSRRENREYAGNICGMSDGTFVYTAPVQGGPTGVDPKSLNPCPAGSTDAGWYHTHGAWIEESVNPATGLDMNEVFTGLGGDIGHSEFRNVPGWLATPTRRLYRYDPKSKGPPFGGTVADLTGIYGRTP